VAVAGFFRVAELRRFFRVRRSALLWAGLALLGVLVLGVLQGLVVTAVLTLLYLIKRLSRPSVGPLARDPSTAIWGRAERHPDWERPKNALVVRSDGPLFYANTDAVKQRILALVRATEPRPAAVVFDLAASTELDVQTTDTLSELVDELEKDGIELRLANVRQPAREILDRSGLTKRVRIAASLDEAIG
jgi:SulP family sulfate permease